MKIEEVKCLFNNELGDLYSQSEITVLVKISLEFVLQKTRTEIHLLQIEGFVLSAEYVKQLNKIVSELGENKPLQYVLGETEFYGLLFKVNEKVLIPRSETEELVDWVLRDDAIKLGNILDVGTGSGCIPIVLKKYLNYTEVFSVDVSNEALITAKENARINQVAVHFYEKDILIDDLNDLPELDIIVSNPPYITLSEKTLMKENVLSYEPNLALFVDDALLFYRRIAELGIRKLKKGGRLYFEINQYFSQETIQLLEELGYSAIVLKKDMQGNDRMIRAVKKRL